MSAISEFEAAHRAGSREAPRRSIPFRSINALRSPGHDPGLQRHHLLPLQLLSRRCFGAMFAKLGRNRVGFDDFRTNGLLLPATDSATIRTGMPLHRGPHRRYNEMVIERVGQIERAWSQLHRAYPEAARNEAAQRIVLVQSALRRRLLSQRRRFILNRKDPLGSGLDFTALDEMAETLWNST